MHLTTNNHQGAQKAVMKGCMVAVANRSYALVRLTSFTVSVHKDRDIVALRWIKFSSSMGVNLPPRTSAIGGKADVATPLVTDLDL
jgi:hypothetical protein